MNIIISVFVLCCFVDLTIRHNKLKNKIKENKAEHKAFLLEAKRIQKEIE